MVNTAHTSNLHGSGDGILKAAKLGALIQQSRFNLLPLPIQGPYQLALNVGPLQRLTILKEGLCLIGKKNLGQRKISTGTLLSPLPSLFFFPGKNGHECH